MFDISKGYAINSARMGKRAATAKEEPEGEAEEVKVLVHLNPELIAPLDKDAKRCKRARMRQIEAIVAAYLGFNVEVGDMSKVRKAVSKNRGPRLITKGAKEDSANQNDTGQGGGKK